jgi:hypothetical protein
VKTRKMPLTLGAAILLCMVGFAALVAVDHFFLKEKKGFDVDAQNFTDGQYVLHLEASNEKGYLLHDVNIFIDNSSHAAGKSSAYGREGSFYGKYDCDFEELTLTLELVEATGGETLARSVRHWPVDLTSMPFLSKSIFSTKTSRILLEIGIVERNGNIEFDFGGLV